MFYEFWQNNSGGVFEGSRYVLIEASSPEEANARALASAWVYFNGSEKGIDCPCCGDRWYPVKESDASASPSLMGRVLDVVPEGVVVVFADGRVSQEGEALPRGGDSFWAQLLKEGVLWLD